MTEAASNPLVSVIMAVYNCENTLEAAFNSIVKQTYTNWELIVCNDASTDGTGSLLERLAETLDPGKVIIVTNPTNMKLPYSLNRCLDLVTGAYIARMDGDDISEPERLERQVQYLRKHPDVDLVGTAMRRFNDDGDGDVVYPASEEPNRWTLGETLTAPFCHATIVARREVFATVGNYSVAWWTERSEDIDLWFKFFAKGLVGRNLTEPLYRVREDRAAIRRRTRKARIGEAVTRVKGSWSLGYPPKAYLLVLIGVAKIFIPYRVFDWHRELGRRRANRKGPDGA